LLQLVEKESKEDMGLQYKVTRICFVAALISIVIGCAQARIPTPEQPPSSATIPASKTPTAPPPAIDFIANLTEGQPPLKVTFTPVATGEIAQWHWDFGDGQFSNEKTPAHTYTAGGDYTVSLAISGNTGSNVVTKPDYIKVKGAIAISWKEAGNYIGQNKLVEGVIVGTNYYAQGKITFLNFNMPYKGYFTCIIWDSDRSKFIKQFSPNPETYFLNKRVRVKGMIEEYPRGSGTPEVVLKEPSQIEIVEK
jgi:PKD repeat protein